MWGGYGVCVKVARGRIWKSVATGRKVPARDIPAIDGLRVNNVQTAAYPRRTGTPELKTLAGLL